MQQAWKAHICNGVDVNMVAQQLCDDCMVSVRGGLVQRRPSVHCICSLDICMSAAEQLHHLKVASQGCHVERSAPILHIAGIGKRAKTAAKAKAAAQLCMNAGSQHLVFGIYLCPLPEQLQTHIVMVLKGCSMQSMPATLQHHKPQ